MAANTLDSKTQDFLTKMQSQWGMDPTQEIDMNDPMTKLVMTIVVASIEQGRDLYSYDQYIKGCAMSAGIDPDTFDSEVNPTSLAIQNNTTGISTFVSPATYTVKMGGSSLSTMQLSQYIQLGIQGSFNYLNFSGVTPGTFVYGAGGVVGGVAPGVGPNFSRYDGDNAPILATIRQVEAGGNYGAVNYEAVKVGFPTSIDTSNMTLSEVRAYQQSMLDAGAKSSAIGPYQTIGTTLDTWAKQAGVTPDTKMTPEVWDKIGSVGVDNALKATGGDVSRVPTVWYTGNARGDNPNVSAEQLAAYNAKWNRVYETKAAAGPGTTSNPDGLPAGDYKVSTNIIDENGYDYRVLKAADGTEYRRYNDGSVYDSSGDKLIKPPNGVDPSFTQVEVTQDANGKDVFTYSKEGSNLTFKQTEDGNISRSDGQPVTTAGSTVAVAGTRPQAVQAQIEANAAQLEQAKQTLNDANANLNTTLDNYESIIKPSDVPEGWERTVEKQDGVTYATWYDPQNPDATYKSVALDGPDKGTIYGPDPGGGDDVVTGKLTAGDGANQTLTQGDLNQALSETGNAAKLQIASEEQATVLDNNGLGAPVEVGAAGGGGGAGAAPAAAASAAGMMGGC